MKEYYIEIRYLWFRKGWKMNCGSSRKLGSNGISNEARLTDSVNHYLTQFGSRKFQMSIT